LAQYVNNPQERKFADFSLFAILCLAQHEEHERISEARKRIRSASPVIPELI
jgi:hypothetical protein